MAINTNAVTSARTLRIVDRLRFGPMRFSAIERAIEAPNPVMLSAHLKKMCRDGLIERRVLKLGPPAHVEYALTPLGADMAKPAAGLIGWVDGHRQDIETARERSRVATEVDHAMAARNADAA